MALKWVQSANKEISLLKSCLESQYFEKRKRTWEVHKQRVSAVSIPRCLNDCIVYTNLSRRLSGHYNKETIKRVAGADILINNRSNVKQIIICAMLQENIVGASVGSPNWGDPATNKSPLTGSHHEIHRYRRLSS